VNHIALPIRSLSPLLSFWATVKRLVLAGTVFAAAGLADDRYYQAEIVPILEESCYDCHDYESKKGGFSIDDYFTFDAVSQDVDQWFAVFKNLQAHVMPPPEKDPPTSQDRQKILSWIKRDVFQIDPANPDPGYVSHRRLNRIEYENTLHELTGVRIDAADLLPADDTGYGFDNIADALSISPLLLEKYIRIANDVIETSIPEEPYQYPSQKIPSRQFKLGNGKPATHSLPFSEAHRAETSFHVSSKGNHRIAIHLNATRFFNFDYGKAIIGIRVDGNAIGSSELIHSPESTRKLEFETPLDPGKHILEITLNPNYDVDRIDSEMKVEIDSAIIEGPLHESYLTLRPEYAQYFPEGPAPESGGAREAYAKRILKRFAQKAYRRPAEDATVNRLTEFAMTSMERDGLTFEKGIAKALTAILSSPHFLYRVEKPLPPSSPNDYPLIDEFALASRLSYFFWSTMPDEALFELAAAGQLRKNLDAQVQRMLEDEKSIALAENFVGQWLQSRDIPLIGLNERAILEGDGRPDRRFRLRADVRDAMRRETEMSFQYLLEGNRSLLELLHADYTFLNKSLAEHYGIEGVDHSEMRKVNLPPDSYRGGVLTQATILGVTSNPTRTSPVKRGLFILENLLGTPSPPAPPDVPELEEAEREFAEDHVPNMRELMEVHREKPLCRSCHERMDPLGLALENFNAMGMWRDDQAGTPIDPSGVLVTGETFEDVRDLKRILANERRLDYYRVVSEKMMTYAIGRGLDYYDTHTIDSLVKDLDSNGGRIMTLITGIVHSPAFQKTRPPKDSRSLATRN